MAKAQTACTSAQALLALGDTDGAANRAYYAMFDAARAALLSSGAQVDPEIGRTHSGLIGAFGSHLVKTGLVSRDLGRQLNRAHEIRLVADYTDGSVDLSDVRELVRQATQFVEAMQIAFLPGTAPTD